MVCRVSSKDRADRAGRAKERDGVQASVLGLLLVVVHGLAAVHPT